MRVEGGAEYDKLTWEQSAQRVSGRVAALSDLWASKRFGESLPSRQVKMCRGHHWLRQLWRM